MRLLFFLVFNLSQKPDSAARPLAAMDSLYLARDTAGLVRALRSWKGDSAPRLELYRGVVAAMSSEKMVDALESFGSVFIPFYFFHAGTEILAEHISWRAIAAGILFMAALVPVRVAVISVVNTTLPAFVLRAQPADFEDPEALPPRASATAQ